RITRSGGRRDASSGLSDQRARLIRREAVEAARAADADDLLLRAAGRGVRGVPRHRIRASAAAIDVAHLRGDVGVRVVPIPKAKSVVRCLMRESLATLARWRQDLAIDNRTLEIFITP